MRFVKLIINELTKIIKKKSTIVFIIISILSIIISCILVETKKDYYMISSNRTIKTRIEVEYNLARYEGLLKNEKAEQKKNSLKATIKLYQYLLDNETENIINAQYKDEIIPKLITSYDELYSINKNENEEYYNIKERNIDKLFEILKNGTFEEYIQFNKDEILQSYDLKEINYEEYISQIQEQDKILKYEIGKYMPENTAWKTIVMQDIDNNNYNIESRYDFSKSKYIDDDELENLINQNLIDEYRLENNIAPYYTDSQSMNNVLSYSRYKYNQFSNTLSIICIGILVIILASQSVAEEISKGTIKFLLITPCKRYKIILAKIISILITIIILIFLLSQISVLIGNIVFGANTNNYIYTSNGEVKIMSTYMYETLQYILRIPELFIYLLIGVVFSTLTRNTAISTVITSFLFIGFPIGMKYLNSFMQIDYLKYIPFNNFDLADKILRLENYEITYPIISKLPLSSSIVVLSITSILLFIAIFESFNKKDI